jgi:hypothetical protein
MNQIAKEIRMRRLLPPAIAAFTVLVVIGVPLTMAASQQFTLAPGDTLTVSCSTQLTGSVGARQAQLACAANPAATPTPTPDPGHAGSGVGVCGESNDLWHAPVVNNNCATGHEHGDAPPSWVTASRWMPMFTHPGNTPNENILKHTSFKGFSGRFNNVDVYVIMHLDQNPSGHTSRFHSYQMWARDNSGAVSHWDGWLDFGDGDSAGPTLRRIGCEDTSVRPIFFVNDRACNGGRLQFESWYSRAAGFQGNALWMPDFGFNMSANYYVGGNPDDRSTWSAVETGTSNGTRRFEVAWYANRSTNRGSFYATNFGQVVTGPNDPLCGTTRIVGGKSYPVLCIEQFIAPSMSTVQFPNNSVQKVYPMTGVVNPN